MEIHLEVDGEEPSSHRHLFIQSWMQRTFRAMDIHLLIHSLIQSFIFSFRGGWRRASKPWTFICQENIHKEHNNLNYSNKSTKTQLLCVPESFENKIPF